MEPVLNHLLSGAISNIKNRLIALPTTRSILTQQEFCNQVKVISKGGFHQKKGGIVYIKP